MRWRASGFGANMASMRAAFFGALGDHSAMLEIGRRANATALLTLALCSIVRATQAPGGDGPSSADPAHGANAASSPATRDVSASMFPAPFASARPLPIEDGFSSTEFQPRRHGVARLESARSGTPIIDAPMLRSTSVWQQMADYKSQDRVRLLTLWQTRGSSLSLQAGKRGAPSLQWSTPWVHREGTSRGLFDRLLTMPARAAGNSPRSGVARPTGVLAQPKPLESNSAGASAK
jgi:hypothetical protein